MMRAELSSRPVLDGGIDTQGGSRGDNAIQLIAENSSTFLPRASSPSNLAPLPASFYSHELDPVSPLRSRPYLLQLALDILAVVVCVFVICATAASLPLAVFLLLFASFD